ncbi:MAG: hypothetical protein F4206_12785 [Gammaproteobacteria bacterium]|nr:hypothetical protein [Gammaproteobacteria bacterium]MYG67584.1 hypothetical protein [Gammaproteobacteria bacterium]
MIDRYNPWRIDISPLSMSDKYSWQVSPTLKCSVVNQCSTNDLSMKFKFPGEHMALFELRQYKVRDGKMEEWLELMEGKIIPYVISKGVAVTASFCAEDDDTKYFWIRRFNDEVDRVERNAELNESEYWQTNFKPRIRELLVVEEAVINRVVPTRVSPMQ